jgi:hypothetical protein
MLTEDFQAASVRVSSQKKKKKIQPGYGAYNAKAQNCVPNVFRREMERQIMQPGDVKTEDRVVVIVNQVEEIYMIAS